MYALQVRAEASGAMRRASGRGLVLLPAGAFVVHQLRYSLGYGPQAGAQLADQGHAYLGSLVPWLVLASAGAFGSTLARIAAAQRSGRTRRVYPFATVWATSAIALVAIYAGQESLEGIFAAGHPGGLAGVFGHGGWWSLPAAVAVALVIALLVRVGAALERAAARPMQFVFAPSPARLWRPRTLQLVAPRPLAFAVAGRAPPRA